MIGYFTGNKSSLIGIGTSAGLTFGSCLAIVVSYTAWSSIPWAILHVLLSWVYVIYYAICHLGN